MDYLQTMWLYILAIVNFIAPYLKLILLSPLAAALITAAVAAYFGIKSFLTQQRISRVQKIYYEESLLDQLKHMDNAINTTSESYSIFLSAMNLIKDNNFNLNQQINNSLNELALQIKVVPSYLSSKREVLIILFGKKGYILHQWLFKYDRDIKEFNLFIRENLIWFTTTSQTNEQQIQSQITEVTNNFELIQRHFTLPYIFNEIISLIGLYDFKSREALIKKIKNDKEIRNYIDKLDEAFKILFGWFKKEHNQYLSYLKDEEDNRYIFTLGQSQLQPTKEVDPDPTQMRIISNDINLINCQVQINGKAQTYAALQTGIANLVSFNEKPQFYEEAKSFENFT